MSAGQLFSEGAKPHAGSQSGSGRDYGWIGHALVSEKRCRAGGPRPLKLRSAWDRKRYPGSRRWKTWKRRSSWQQWRRPRQTAALDCVRENPGAALNVLDRPTTSTLGNGLVPRLKHRSGILETAGGLDEAETFHDLRTGQKLRRVWNPMSAVGRGCPTRTCGCRGTDPVRRA